METLSSLKFINCLKTPLDPEKERLKSSGEVDLLNVRFNIRQDSEGMGTTVDPTLGRKLTSRNIETHSKVVFTIFLRILKLSHVRLVQQTGIRVLEGYVFVLRDSQPRISTRFFLRRNSRCCHLVDFRDLSYHSFRIHNS